MKKKKIVVTFELLDESVEEKNENIMQELVDWFENVTTPIPWVKSVKAIAVKDE